MNTKVLINLYALFWISKFKKVWKSMFVRFKRKVLIFQIYRNWFEWIWILKTKVIKEIRKTEKEKKKKTGQKKM